MRREQEIEHDTALQYLSHYACSRPYACPDKDLLFSRGESCQE